MSQPRAVAAVTGIDALAHAIESYVCTQRERPSRRLLLVEACRYLEPNFEAGAVGTRTIWKPAPRCSSAPTSPASPSRTPCSASAIVRQSADRSLRHHPRHGHRHAVAARDPLQRRRRSEHHYAGFRNDHSWATASRFGDPRRPHHRILPPSPDLPTRLRDCGVSESILALLAEEACQQWTAKFNPRPALEEELLGVYRATW